MLKEDKQALEKVGQSKRFLLAPTCDRFGVGQVAESFSSNVKTMQSNVQLLESRFNALVRSLSVPSLVDSRSFV